MPRQFSGYRESLSVGTGSLKQVEEKDGGFAGVIYDEDATATSEIGIHRNGRGREIGL